MRPCVVCDDVKEQGVRVLHAFLCDACQQEMVAVDATDERYELYVRRMAAFWRSLAEASID